MPVGVVVDHPGDPAVPVGGDRHEEVSVLPGLGDHERDVKNQGGDGRERKLGRGVLQSGLGDGDAGQHQAQPGQGDDRRERRPGARGVEGHRAVPQRTGQQAQAHNPVQGDHHRGEHGVAGVGRGARSAAAHQHHDQTDLDHGDRDRQDQRSVRLTGAGGDHLGVVDRREDGADQDDGDQRQHGGKFVARPGHEEDSQRGEWHHHGPLQRPPPRRPVHHGQQP